VAGHKPYEFRGWRAPSSIIGQRIAIHAGVKKIHPLEIRSLVTRLQGDEAWKTALKPGAMQFLRDVLSGIRVLPRGAVIGTAVLGEPKSAADIVHEFGGAMNDSERHDHANWAWPMLDVEALQPYVPAKGAQGFWNWRES
jgi:hypothetical protein